MRRATRLIVLGALALLAACSNIETPDLDADVRNEGIIPQDWQPLPLRVGLAPFPDPLAGALQEKAVVHNKQGGRRWVFDPNEDRLNRGDGSLHSDMLDALVKYRMFERIEPIRGATPDMPLAQMQALALQQGLDLVVVPKVLRHDVAYVGSNSAYGWNMFVWWMVSPIISWWIADEDFEINVHVQLQLHSVTGSASHVMLKRLEPPQKIVRSFDDWDEGFNLFSIYSTPSHFDESNWRNILDKLQPIADNEVKKAALRWIVNDLRQEARKESFRQQIRRRVALVIGVDGTGKNTIPLSQFAGIDAGKVVQHLQEANSLPIAQGAMRDAIGSSATLQAVRQRAAELAPLARANDDVIVYFSGVGTVETDGTPALVLTQSTPGETERITLTELLNLILANKPRTLTLILDCSFTAPDDRRCAANPDVLSALRKSGMTESLLLPVIERVEQGGTHCIVLSATDAVIRDEDPMPALEIEDLARGLFTSFALQGLSGDATTAETSGATVSELAEYLRTRVTHIAGLEGANQTGWYHVPEDARDLRLPARRIVSGAGGQD